MAKRLVIANWKMNGNLALVQETLGSLQSQSNVEVVIVPPAIYVGAFAASLPTSFALGLQNVSQFSAGAHTGEIAASMAAENGVSWVLAGHSERRVGHGEDDEIVAAKVARALEAGLSVVICVGESLAIREAGEAEDFVRQQIRAQAAAFAMSGQVAIAYEPIWAIGSGISATAEQAVAMHKVIRQTLNEVAAEQTEGVRVLYGGSVNADNAESLFQHPEIEGVLVGGASLDNAQFAAIIRAASEAAA